MSNLPPEVAATIAAIEVLTTRGAKGAVRIERVLKVEVWDKVRALELLAKHLGMLKERVEIGAPVPLFALPAGTRVDVGLRPRPAPAGGSGRRAAACQADARSAFALEWRTAKRRGAIDGNDESRRQGRGRGAHCLA